MHPNEDVLNDYVDEALAAPARADLEQHLAGCSDCRALVEDLREIRRAAASLELREPPLRAWSRVERAIQLEQQHRAETRPNGARAAWTWLAAAAAVLVAVAVGLRYRPAAPQTAPAAATASAPAADASSESVEAELRAAEEHYDKAIRGLEQITNAEKGALDTQTAATLQKNLSVIDQAISESRAAVRSQPASQPAQESLIESFKAKLALLQDTVALINEMRKGSDAGGARVGSGVREKG